MQIIIIATKSQYQITQIVKEVKCNQIRSLKVSTTIRVTKFTININYQFTHVK